MGVKTFNDFTFTALHRDHAKVLTSSPKAYFNEGKKNKWMKIEINIEVSAFAICAATLMHSLNSHPLTR